MRSYGGLNFFVSGIIYLHNWNGYEFRDWTTTCVDGSSIDFCFVLEPIAL